MMVKVQEQLVKCPNCGVDDTIGNTIGVSSTDSALYICPHCRYAEMVEDGTITNFGDK